MYQTFSCSTMWNIRGHNNAANALREIKEIGFDAVELNYHVTEDMLKQMAQYIEHGNIQVSSVHNVMPRTNNDDFGTNSPFLGYLEDEKRNMSIELTKRTIDYANHLKASAVVLHVSQLPINKDYDQQMKLLVREGKRNSEEYTHVLQEYRKKYNELVSIVMERTIQSLVILSDYVEKKQYSIKLGIENRALVHQIPTLEELEIMLPRLEGTPCGLWYDIGHGILMENLGICSYFPKVHSFFSKLVGVHIHDAQSVKDHYYPYKFGDRFDQYLPIIQAAPIKVFEVGPKNSREELKSSLSLIRDKCNKLN